MVHRISNIVARLPEDEAAVIALLHDSGEFQALCDEYATIGEELEVLVRLDLANADAQIRVLRKRHLTVDEEIVTRIEGYRPT
jgi:hypothetical protein